MSHYAYDPHLREFVDVHGNPMETKREKLIKPRNKPPKPPPSKGPWDDARRAALLLEIRRSVKHFKPDPDSDWHKEHPDASRDELAQSLCELLTRDWPDRDVESYLRMNWRMAHRPLCQLMSFRRRF
jgi:hypothetical protein